MQFVLTIDVPTSDRPGIAIAQTMREAAAVIETMVPLADHHHIIDRFGVQTCEWTMAEPEPEV